MNRGIYTAATGMGVQQARLDLITNNLANVDTVGFKKDRIVQQTFPDLLLVEQKRDQSPASRILNKNWRFVGTLNQGAAVTDVVTDFSPGRIEETGKATDLALKQFNAFFVVSGQDGQEYFSRDGLLQIDSEGYLVDSRGNRVMGDNGPVEVGAGQFSIDQDGVVKVSGQETGRIRIMEVQDLAQLEKAGDNYYIPRDEGQRAGNPGVLQGFLEKSNIELAAEMVGLINVARSYEANQKMVQSQDHLLQLAVNDIGNFR